MQTVLMSMANVSPFQVRGVRAPYLQMGGDNQMLAMQWWQSNGAKKFVYDSTRSSIDDRNLWPYTYDYDSTQDCPSGGCPTKSFPGISNNLNLLLLTKL